MNERDSCILWMAELPDLDYGLMAVDYLISLQAGTILKRDGIESFTDWVLAKRCPEQVLRNSQGISDENKYRTSRF